MAFVFAMSDIITGRRTPECWRPSISDNSANFELDLLTRHILLPDLEAILK